MLQKGAFMAYTNRWNINRGYMKLDVWKEALDLFASVQSSLSRCEKLDFKLRGQLLDAAQSIGANIAEGYCRKSINEYLQFLNVALGSAGETLTRMIGLEKIGCINQEDFEKLDRSHYSVENKLIALVKSLQAKRKSGTWQDEFKEQTGEYEP